eukprot:7891114-Alexandrium_andersonii.AAC.1
MWVLGVLGWLGRLSRREFGGLDGPLPRLLLLECATRPSPEATKQRRQAAAEAKERKKARVSMSDAPDA